MKTFQDTKKRGWTLDLNIGAVKRVQELVHVDLLNPLGTGRKKVHGKDRRRRKPQPLVTKLQLNLVLLVDVIFALLKPQADEQGVSDLDFAEGLGGDAAYDAYQAFMDEWRDFFLRLRRETEAKAIEANREMVAAEDKKNAVVVDRVTEATTKVMASRREKAIKKIGTLGHSETATDSPESSDSIPGPSTP